MINRHFTALKGLAIVLVVLSHSISLFSDALGSHGYAQPPESVQFVFIAVRELGLVSVPIFLFLSAGYVVYAVEGKGLLSGYKAIWAGLKHIIWPYLIWSIVFYVVIFVLLNDQFTLLQYGKDLLVGYPFNYVPLLVFFYLAGPLLVNFGRRHPWLLLSATAAYQLFLINVNTPGALGVVFPGWARYLVPPILRTTLAFWGIFFPLGAVYGLHAKALLSPLKRIWPALVGVGAVLYVLRVVEIIGRRDATLAGDLYPMALILLSPLLKRESIPFVNSMEQCGKKAYALYLTNLIVLSTILAVTNVIAPWAFGAPLLLTPLLFVVTLVLPTGMMLALDRLRLRGVQRYVFG